MFSKILKIFSRGTFLKSSLKGESGQNYEVKWLCNPSTDFYKEELNRFGSTIEFETTWYTERCYQIHSKGAGRGKAPPKSKFSLPLLILACSSSINSARRMKRFGIMEIVSKEHE